MLFSHEDAIILGMLFSKYFAAVTYPINRGSSGGGYWSGGGGGGPTPIVTPQTGRGGVTFEPYTGKSIFNGDNGRPGASDAATTLVDPSLVGFGGNLVSGGQGLHDGQLFFGGNATMATAHQFGNTSAGGGAGLFGGGSAFMDGGGGGGSSWVYSQNHYGLEGLNSLRRLIPDFKVPEHLGVPEWIGVDTSTLDYFKKNRELFTVNTYHTYEYDYAGFKGSLGKAYGAFLNLHNRALGNGLILVSEPNKSIVINRETGSIDGISSIIEYTGRQVEWKPPVDGRYEFILWGAQGGTVFYTRPEDQSYPGQSYTGGFGGAVGLFLDLTVTYTDDDGYIQDTVLYLLVGQRGLINSSTRPWNGGGNSVNASCGGGETDIRWEGQADSPSYQSTFTSRLAVAGGGGGCINTGNGGGQPHLPIDKPGNSNPLQGENPDDTYKIVKDPPYFLVNDRSIVYVTIRYISTETLPSNSQAGCLLFINSGIEGVLYKDFKIDPVQGVVEIKYKLSSIYPKNTETHWVTLEPEVRTNTRFIVPNNGVTIRVETEEGVNEPVGDHSPIIIVNKVETLDFFDSLSVFFETFGGDIRINVFETLETILDKLDINFKEISYIRVDILETFKYLLDKYNILFVEPQPQGDININISEFVRLLDLININLVEMGADIRLSTLETLSSLNEHIQSKLYSVLFSKIHGTDTLNTLDGVSVKLSENPLNQSKLIDLTLDKLLRVWRAERARQRDPVESLEMSDSVNVKLVEIETLNINVRDELIIEDDIHSIIEKEDS